MRAQITTPAFTGSLTSALGQGAEGRWDIANALELTLNSGSLSSLSARDVLNGRNRLAVETGDGWEVLAFANASLEADGSWTLTDLLRGLGGTPVNGAQAGARVVVLDEAGASLGVEAYERGTVLTILGVPPGKAVNDASVRQVNALYAGVEERPLAPVHLRVLLAGDALLFSWVRRARLNADAWGYGDVALDEMREAYEVTLLSGQSIVHTEEVTEPAFTLSASTEALLFPSGLANAQLRVAQISDRFGPGRSAQLDLSIYD